MTTPKQNPSLIKAFSRAKSDIASLADWLECELQKQDVSKATWGDVNALEYVRARLIEVLASFSGIEEEQIKHSLDELHM